MRSALLALAAFATLVALGSGACVLVTDVGRERGYGTWVSETGTAVEIVAVQRVPTAWGAEENVYVRSPASEDEPRLRFDINGRFGPELRVDISADGRWVRIWSEFDPPLIGEVGDVPPDSHYFLDHSLGQTERQDVFRASPIAYVNLQARFVLHSASATPAERRDVLRLHPELAGQEVIRGERIDWSRATRR